MTSAAFAFSSGPRDAKIAFVGEAMGQQEELLGRPFVGSAGQELSQLLKDIGIEREECFITNLISFRPSASSNNFDLLCGSKAEVGGKDYTLPPLKAGKYLKPEYLPELERLKEEINLVNPNIVVALGGKASWGLLRSSAISKIRGSVTPGVLTKHKVLPTFHPSYIIQGGWSDRPVVLCDLAKVKREASFREFIRPKRSVLIDPTLAELEQWVNQTLEEPPALLSCDIETKSGQIESIAFAKSKSNAVVCPFIAFKPMRSYWPTLFEELDARWLCNRLLSSALPKLFQNGLFDIQWLLREGFDLRSCVEDSMLLHHSIYPELKKGLGFLGSCYSNEPSWKLMRKRSKEEELKSDE